MYIIINIILVISILALILLGLKFNKKSNEKLEKIGQWLEEFIKKYYKILVMLLLFLTFFTSIFKITTLPYGLHVDEAGLSYDAISIAKYGVDRYLRSYPVWLNNYYGSQSSMYAYILVILIKIFGYSKLLLRLPAVIFRLLIFISMLWVLKDEKNQLKSVLFLFIFAICPYFIMNSRWALDCNLLVGFITISECILIKSILKSSNKLLFISGIFFGLSLYTYALSFIIIPLILLLDCIYLLHIKEFNFKKLVIFGIPIFLFSIPLMLMLLINNGYVEEISGFITIPKLVGYRGSDIMFPNFIENFYIIGTIFSFDNTRIFGSVYWYNALEEFGTIYYANIPFFLLGFAWAFTKMVKSIKEKKFDINSIFIFWFLAVLFCMFMVKTPTIHRANAIFTPIVYFVAIGIYVAFKKSKAFIIPVTLILTINFGMFLNYYFREYNKNSEGKFLFATTYLDVLDYAKSLKREDIYFDQLLTSEQYIYTLLDHEVSPYSYNTELIVGEYEGTEITYHFEDNSKWEELNSNAVYVTGPSEDLLARFTDSGFSHKQFGIYRVFYCEE
ncbi:MAG: glycosyltransferase family 39 protein [Clostridia bacterium]|nr:glycosyltransferase family 39 protein [Clostridia bacterium]